GGSRGNPGMGASGAVLYAVDAGQLTEVWTSSRFLGAADVTCNQAEYQALIDGLRQAVKMRLTSLTVQGDSSLVVNQMLGQWKVNNARLLQLVGVAKRLLQRLPAASLEWIPRAQNSRADSLCNTAMDA
ncbi:ribonuclease H-like domain-containing protein, partial [Ochromonadaceae sp. CCMP2298]